MLKIGPYQHSSRVVVAPMAGVTDQPFRDMCRALGTYWVVSEMITSDSRLWQTRKSRLRLHSHDESEPRWVQIAGADPGMMAEAALLNEERGAQILDINMGCPAKKVCNKAAGSALMKNETLVRQIIEAVVGAVTIPVTLKMRLGWSKAEQNAIEVARIAAESGVCLITVHGRTRACKFSGRVDYDAIGDVKAAVDIPVVANGDIDSANVAADVVKATGCDGVMVGRAAQGRPWLPAMIDRFLDTGIAQKEPDRREISELIVTHIKKLHRFYGEVMGVRIARKHVGWYLGELSSGEFGRRFNRLDSSDAQMSAILEVFGKQGDLVA